MHNQYKQIEFVPVVWSAPDDFDSDELEDYVFEGAFEVAELTGDVDVS